MKGEWLEEGLLWILDILLAITVGAALGYFIVFIAG